MEASGTPQRMFCISFSQYARLGGGGRNETAVASGALPKTTCT